MRARWLTVTLLCVALILGYGVGRTLNAPIVIKFYAIIPEAHPAPGASAGETATKCFYGPWRRLDHCIT